MRQNIKKVHKHYFSMQQGQISIDLLVTLIVVVMLIGAFTLILSGFQSGQEEFFLRTQLKENSANLASFITSTNSLSDINFTTKIMIHPINYKNVSKRPFVTIDNNYLLLTVDTDIGLIEEKSFFSKPINSEITREGELLVISNE